MVATTSNYFFGADPSAWHTDVPNFDSIVYSGVREGIDLVFRGNGGELEYDLVVHPGARAEDASLDVGGNAIVQTTDDGGLVVQTTAGALYEPPPIVYQIGDDGTRVVREGRYRAIGRRIAFDVGTYDQHRSLVIDPAIVLTYSTHLGGNDYDDGLGIAVDASGNAYLAGDTFSTTFPTKSPLQPSKATGTDAFIVKLNAAGSALVYATYFGGTGEDFARGITVDTGGNVYVAGYTSAADFPTQSPVRPYSGGQDAFITKLNPSGSALVYSTYLGGFGSDQATGIAIDPIGNAYVTGWTTSADLPVQAAFQGGLGGQVDAFVTKLNASGSALAYSTYLGGLKDDGSAAIAVDSSGNAYVTGTTQSSNFPRVAPFQATLADGVDAFVMKVGPTGTPVYSTFLGGSAGYDHGYAITADSSGNAYVVGSTSSPAFPTNLPFQSTLGGGQDAFITKLNSTGSALVFSTFLGGSADDVGAGVVIDSADYVSVTGWTQSTNFPTASPFQAALAGMGDVFVTKFAIAGSTLEFSSYLGASDDDFGRAIGVDTTGTVYLTGTTYSQYLFPVKSPVLAAGSYHDAFVTKIGWPPISVSQAFGSIPPKGSKMLAGVGGTGVGYVFSMLVNNSGGSVTPLGAFTAGATGNVSDIVQLVDSENHTTTAPVSIGPGMTLGPLTPNSPPKGTVNFAASGGSGAWSWSIPSNNSGGTIGIGTGVYKAGPSGGVIDTVQVLDTLGNSASTTVTVGPTVTITPASPSTPPQGSIGFTATGGSFSGWIWSIPSNNSGGTIQPNGNYKAGSTSNVVDTVHVSDSLGNVADVNVSVGGGLAINPVNPSTSTKGTISFSIVGGSGSGYVWSLQPNLSGATLDSNGKYVAGTTGSVTDTVQAKDSLNNSVTTNVAVGPGLTITPGTATVKYGQLVTFSAVGGAGTGYAWSVSKNASGATVDPTSGAYVAGLVYGIDTVQVADTLDNRATASVTVGTPPVDAGPDPSTDAAPNDGAPTVDAGTSNGPSSGCGCALVDTRARGGWVLFLAALAFVLRRRRRAMPAS